MKLNLTLMFFVYTLLTCCQSNHKGEKKTGVLSHLVNITDNEDKGIKEILAFYGGQCEYGLGRKISLGDESQKNFWLKVSKSSEIDNFSTVAEMPASNIAYLFYRNLESKNNNYNEIRIELIFEDGKNENFRYSTSQLEKVKTKMQIVDKIIGLIKKKDFKGIKNYIKPDTLFNVDERKLVANLEKADPEFGNITEFIPYGFRFSEAKNGKAILHISGAVNRDKKSHYFCAVLDPNSSKEEIYYLNYDL